MKPGNSYLKVYKPIDSFDLAWGIKVTDAGYTNVRPGDAYPPFHHPRPYMFTWEKGRRLDSYQVVFIGRGRGELETEHGGSVRIESGDVFMLHPGEWHRYRPDPATGWTERWCGFTGTYAKQIAGAFFSAREPVLEGANPTQIRSRLRTIAALFKQGRPAVVPALVVQTIGLLADLSPRGVSRRSPYADAIDKACDELLSLSAENVDLEALACRHGMSYPIFRREFKAQKGVTPHAYIVECRINQAKALLRNSDMPARKIAAETGFSSLAYFSAAFRKHEGASPRAWRLKNGRQAGGGKQAP